MDNIELKPCPFCGGAAKKVLIGNDYTKTRKVEIKCTVCPTTQRIAAIRQNHSWLENSAVERWNERIEQPHP